MSLVDTALDATVGALETVLRAEPLRRARPRRGERRWWALAACGTAMVMLSVIATAVMAAVGPG